MEHIGGDGMLTKKLTTLSTEEIAELGMLQARTLEQSNLFGTMKQRHDELHLQCQTLEKINAELESQMKSSQEALEEQRKKAEMLEKRFRDLAANNEAIIVFKNEYKMQNAQLKRENTHLQEENDSLFSQKLHDSQMTVQKLKQDLNRLQEGFTNKEKEYKEKIARYELKLLKQTSEHQEQETLQCGQIEDLQRRHEDALEMCKDLKVQLQHAKEAHDVRETSLQHDITSLTKERDKLSQLNIERGKLLQEKEKEILQLQMKYKDERKSRIKAEDRFVLEAEVVNADTKVKNLMKKYTVLNTEFEAFKEHSNRLLEKERELNKVLRHLH
ncbi:coiled-coil domain-containing protein 89 isoform 1-T1 [Synchiropus picturatus]